MIIRNASFVIQGGQHTVLKGESGSGKSTILKMLLGFYVPQSGKILLQNSEAHIRELRRYTAWLPQDLNLGEGTVREVIAKPFDFRVNVSNKSDQQHQIDLLKQLGLEANILDKSFRNLSTGQRQRIGLGICVLLGKPLLLLDEPTSALDRKSKECIVNLLLAHTNKTIISMSHDRYWVSQADNIIEPSQWK